MELAGKVGVALQAFEPSEPLLRLCERHRKRLVRTCFVLDKPRSFAACRAPFGSAQDPNIRPDRRSCATPDSSAAVALYAFMWCFWIRWEHWVVRRPSKSDTIRSCVVQAVFEGRQRPGSSPMLAGFRLF